MDRDARKICNGIKGHTRLFSVGGDLSVLVGFFFFASYALVLEKEMKMKKHSPEAFSHI